MMIVWKGEIFGAAYSWLFVRYDMPDGIALTDICAQLRNGRNERASVRE